MMSVTRVSEALVYPSANAVNPGNGENAARDLVTRLRTQGYYAIPGQDADNSAEKLRFQTLPRKLKETTRTADTTGATRSPWLKCNAKSMTVKGSEVVKTAADPEFAVGLMSINLTSQNRSVHWEINVHRTDREWIGIGVANTDIELGESLRQAHPSGRSKQGRAWFYHDRGFLCDGEVFVEDSVPPFSWSEESSCKIGVTWNPSKRELSFSCNGKDIPGVITGITGSDLFPAVYCNGCGTRFEVTRKPTSRKPVPEPPASQKHNMVSSTRSPSVSGPQSSSVMVVSGPSSSSESGAPDARTRSADYSTEDQSDQPAIDPVITSSDRASTSDAKSEQHVGHDSPNIRPADSSLAAGTDTSFGQENKYGNNPRTSEGHSDQENSDHGASGHKELQDKEVSPAAVPFRIARDVPHGVDATPAENGGPREGHSGSEASEEDDQEATKIILSCGATRKFEAHLSPERVEWLARSLDQLQKQEDAARSPVGVDRASVRNGDVEHSKELMKPGFDSEKVENVLESVLVKGVEALRQQRRLSACQSDDNSSTKTKGWRRWLTCFGGGSKSRKSVQRLSEEDFDEIGL